MIVCCDIFIFSCPASSSFVSSNEDEVSELLSVRCLQDSVEVIRTEKKFAFSSQTIEVTAPVLSVRDFPKAALDRAHWSESRITEGKLLVGLKETEKNSTLWKRKDIFRNFFNSNNNKAQNSDHGIYLEISRLFRWVRNNFTSYMFVSIAIS